MFMSKARFLADRAPKWGDDAAEWDWRLEKVFLGMLVAIFVLLPVSAALMGAGDRDAGLGCLGAL